VSGVLKWGTARDRAAFSFFAERGFGANRGFVTRRFNTADTPLFQRRKRETTFRGRSLLEKWPRGSSDGFLP
jgi:hypothetical protein